MESVRERLARRFDSFARKREPEEMIGDAIYALLRSASELEIVVDGWTLFKVMRESENALEAVGLMTLLPSGSIPILVNVGLGAESLTWSIQVGEQRPDWCALSESKRWNHVYLYATASTQEPPLVWGRRYQGEVS